MPIADRSDTCSPPDASWTIQGNDPLPTTGQDALDDVEGTDHNAA